MGRFRRQRRIVRQLLLGQIFRQEDEELLNTAHGIFMMSLTLLFIGVLLTAGLVFVGEVSMVQGSVMGAGGPVRYGLYAVLLVMVSTVLLVLIKMGSFEEARAHFVWVASVCSLVSIVMIGRLLVSLVG